MKNALGKEESAWLDNAFPDDRLRETDKPDPGLVEALRAGAVAFARVILESCPSSADRSAALRDVRAAHAAARDSLSKRLGRV